MNQAPRTIPLTIRYRKLIWLICAAVSLFCLAWPVAILIYLVIQLLDPSDNNSWNGIASFIQFYVMLMMGGAVAFHRISKNPFNKPGKNYLQFLATSTWCFGKPLPMGTCYFTLGDGLLVLALNLVGVGRLFAVMPEHARDDIAIFFGTDQFLYLQLTVLVSLASMLIPYIAVQLINANWSAFQVQILLLLTPLTVYPHFNVYIFMAVLIAIYLLCVCVIRQNLQKLQWEWPYYDPDPVARLRKEAGKSKMIIGSVQRLAPNVPLNDLTLQGKLILALMLCWWTHAIIGCIYHLDRNFEFDRLLAIPFIMITILVFGGRNLVRFVAMSPVHLYARPFIGLLHIRRFDRIIISPMLMCMVGGILTHLFIRQRINGPEYLYALGLAFVLIHHFTSPRPEVWQYTWGHSRHFGKQPVPASLKRNGTPASDINISLT